MTRQPIRSRLAYLAAILIPTQLALLGMDAVAGSPGNLLVTRATAVLLAVVLLGVVRQRDQARAELTRLRATSGGGP